MRFVNKTGSGWIDAAIHLAEKMLTPGSKMLLDVWHKRDFKYESHKVGDVFLELIKDHSAIELKLYRPLNPFTRAIAMTKKNDPAIYFNIYKFGKTSAIEFAGTILHEYAHKCGFSHGSNWKTKEKCLYSVPYYLSENISRWL